MAALNINGFFPGELVPDATIAGCIDIFENVWPDPDDTIKRVEADITPESGTYWTRAETIGQGAFQDARTNKFIPVSFLANVNNNQLLQNIHNQFHMTLLASVYSYAKRYGITDQLNFEGYSLLKYAVGEEYKQHSDGGTSSARAISALLYLNDEFEGGELEFPYFGVKIKPKPGMLILFPSNFAYSHIAHPITKGKKYCLVTWIRDRYKDD